VICFAFYILAAIRFAIGGCERGQDGMQMAERLDKRLPNVPLGKESSGKPGGISSTHSCAREFVAITGKEALERKHEAEATGGKESKGTMEGTCPADICTIMRPRTTSTITSRCIYSMWCHLPFAEMPPATNRVERPGTRSVSTFQLRAGAGIAHQRAASSLLPKRTAV